MAGLSAGAGAIQALFDGGSLAGLDDAGLLDRFASGGDGAEEAFAAIVARHGPMVLDVCRASAGADAEDAFQAVFLVLASRASAVRSRGSLGPWLFGVARRVSARARSDAARRRSRELRAAEASSIAVEPTRPCEDASILLDEVDRLPTRYREPVVLCHLQGLTYQAAAHRIGCPLGTLSVRLRRAKERLKVALERRGVDPAAPLVVLPGVALPRPLAASTAKLAALVASGLGRGVPASVLTLARGGLRGMRIARTLGASAVVLGLAIGAWAWDASASGQGPVEAGAKPKAPVAYQLAGRVTDADTGQPVAGAAIQVQTTEARLDGYVAKSAVSDADGRYAVDLPVGDSSMIRLTPPAGWWVAPEQVIDTTPFALSPTDPVRRKDFSVRREAVWEFRLAWEDKKPAPRGQLYGRFGDAAADDEGLARMGLPRAGGEVEVTVEPPGKWYDPSLSLKIRRDDQFRPEAVRSIERLEGAGDRYRLTDRDGRSASIEAQTEGRIAPRQDDGRMTIHVAFPNDEPGVLPEIGGTIEDPMGRPIPGALVELVYGWKHGEGSYGESRIGSEHCRATTDERGRYRLDCVPDAVAGRAPDSIRLAVSRDGYVDASTEQADVVKGSPTNFRPVVMKTSCSVVGTVVDPDGKPVEGAQVMGSLPTSRHILARTDAAGRFRLDGLSQGPASIYIRYGNLTNDQEIRFEASRDPQPVEFRLFPIPNFDAPLQAPQGEVL